MEETRFLFKDAIVSGENFNRSTLMESRNNFIIYFDVDIAKVDRGIPTYLKSDEFNNKTQIDINASKNKTMIVHNKDTQVTSLFIKNKDGILIEITLNILNENVFKNINDSNDIKLLLELIIHIATNGDNIMFEKHFNVRVTPDEFFYKCTHVDDVLIRHLMCDTKFYKLGLLDTNGLDLDENIENILLLLVKTHIHNLNNPKQIFHELSIVF